MQKSWNNTIAALNKYREFKKEYEILQKKFSYTQQELLFAREKVAAAGNFIHPDIGKKLSAMANAAKRNGQNVPDRITREEVAILCKEVREKITFVPIVPNTYGE